VEILGLEARGSDLARGIVIARASKPLSADAQHALWKALAEAGVTEVSDEDEETSDDPIARQWLAAPWIPPAFDQVDPQRLAFEAAAATYELEMVWLVKVETGIDGLAWQELSREVDEEVTAETTSELGDAEVVDAIFEDTSEVIYAAPDASGAMRALTPPVPEASDDDEDDEDDDEDDEDDDEDDELDDMASHWRNGLPPLEHAVTFPIERYPDIIEQYDWESFGVAVKLAGEPLPGEESVINAFFALWLSAYQDERTEEFEPFQRADVVHDRLHRSALMWVERFAVPASAADQVHFLLWIVARINDILPISWARFDPVDDAVKSRAQVDLDDEASDEVDEPPFVLAGNPFADRFERQGEGAAMAWAVGQSAWSKRELAGMLVEVALEHDPDEPEPAATAERLLLRALAFDTSCDANGYLAIVLVRQDRVVEAIELAERGGREVRLLVVGEVAEHRIANLPATLALLDEATIARTPPEEIAELVATVARHAPDYTSAILDTLPRDAKLVPHLYNASFTAPRPQALVILRAVLAMPAPPTDAPDARSAYVMAWNNACIHAHALGDFAAAVELADGGQPYASENPYIYHSAACAYASVGAVERAIQQVALAIEHEYEHAEKMETDVDLASLHGDARFTALFTEWRERRADLN